jgi:hypothetical protein
MMTGANGETLPGLNFEWAFRKSKECELILAASVVFQLMNQLVNASLGGPWPGQFTESTTMQAEQCGCAMECSTDVWKPRRRRAFANTDERGDEAEIA